MGADAGLQFVDTNVLVYAYDRSTGARHVCASKLVAELWQSGRGCLSIQVLQEFYVVVTRKLSPAPFADVRVVLSDLALWRIHTPVAADVLAAADLHQRYQVSFWDAMILRSAVHLGCTTVWSEDLNPGQAYQGVHVVNPFAATVK